MSWIKSISPEGYQRSPAAYALWLGPKFFTEGQAGATLAGVTLDGVVYSDGTFARPDTTGVLQRYVVHRWAARDAAIATLGYLRANAGMPPAELAAALHAQLHAEILRDVPVSQETLLARYAHARYDLAYDLEGLLATGGLAGLKKKLRLLLAHEPGGMSALGRQYARLSANDPPVFGTARWRMGRRVAQGHP